MNPWSVIEERTRDEYTRFRAGLADPETAQRRQLASILAANAKSAVGRRYGFADARDPNEFRARVPMHEYHDLAPDLEATGNGASAWAVCEPVIVCERTSGSSGATKLIPYTDAALRAFRRALHPWLHDLIVGWPRLAQGRAYFALSPAARRETHTPGGIPVGMDDDAGYFGAELAEPLAALLAVPSALANVSDVDSWRYLTLRCLVDADDLTLVSVWSPTFFTTLLGSLRDVAQHLVRDVAGGTAVAPTGFAPGWDFQPRPERAEQVRVALSGSQPDAAALWPQLTLLSCWADGAAARFVPPLERAMPGITVQGKGLLATEGVTSLPLVEFDYPVLAVNSGFYEFVDATGRSSLAHELTAGGVYRLVLTTHGGLYRYDIGDQVRVRGHADATPMLEFLGRGGCVSDLCGEKITEMHVRESLAGDTGFAILVPSMRGGPRYRLVLDAAERDRAGAERLAHRVERKLRDNPQYDHARRLGQLGPVTAERHDRALNAYLRWLEARGRRLGDIKPPLLYRELDWERMFEDD